MTTIDRLDLPPRPRRPSPLVRLLGPTPDAYTPYATLPKVRRVQRWFLGLLGVTLVGYAIINKSFAYIGVAPIFIGEVCLLLGVASLFGCAWSSLKGTLRLAVPLLLFMGWGAVCTFPYFNEHQFDALRDGVIWGYGFFALILCALVLDKPTRLRWMVRYYGIFSVIFLVVAPATMIFIRAVGGDNLGRGVPTFPGTEIPLAFIKGGDIGVHLAGVFGYAVLLGSLPTVFLLLTIPLNGALMQSSRAALVCFATALVPYFAYRPRHKIGWLLLGWLLVGFTLLWSSGFVWAPEGEKREFSAKNIIQSVQSLVGAGGHEEMNHTKKWRMWWWEDIVEYTFDGPYFWYGKGYGVNLADSDGFQVEFDETPLRSPHNGHLTVLARSGVPGLGLWVACHASLTLLLTARLWEAHRRGDEAWARALLWLGTMHVIFLINATFDVFLEGPMGGIWFWSIFGVALAAAELSRTHPGLLDGAVKTDGRPVGRTRNRLKRIAARVR